MKLFGRSTTIAVATLLVFAATPQAARAASGVEEEIQAGLEAYDTAQAETLRRARLEGFRKAERHFRAAIDDGAANAALYTNLGNAALQAEHLGEAVLAYRRALDLDPDHRRARANLVHARSLLPGWVPRPPEAGILDTFFFWQATMSEADRARAEALAFALAAAVFGASMALHLRWLRSLVVIPGLVWLGLVASGRIGGDTGAGAAVITAPETIARASDSVNAPSRYGDPLPSGTEVTILERRGDWLRVRLGAEAEAWIRAAAVGEV
jgi:tetratricopeptide (TPR) repeat protein